MASADEVFPTGREEGQMRNNLEMQAVENAIAQQRIECLEVPPDVIEDMKRAARGEISIEEGINRTLSKFMSREKD